MDQGISATDTGAHSMSQPTNTKSLKSIAFADLDREIDATRKILQRLPEQHLNWKAHEKSMSLGRLAMHVATLFQWMLAPIDPDPLDRATAPPPRQEPSGRDDLLQTFETNAAAVKA